MAVLIKRHQEARDALTKGVNELADTVIITLGPKGHNVAVDKRWSAPNVVHDGAMVAKAIVLKDPFENMGAEMVKEAAVKMSDLAGDGTTTTTLIAQSIINQGNEMIKNGANGMVIKKGILKAVKIVVHDIQMRAKKLKTKEETAAIASISASDPVVGRLIADAIEKVGKNGVIAVEAGASNTTTVKHKEGMEFEQGYQSSAFITNPDRQLCEIKDPYILFADFNITNSDEIATFIEKFFKETNSKNLVFITDGVEDSALMTLKINGKGGRGAINTCAVIAPGIGSKRQELLTDMAFLTGGQAAFKDNGLDILSVPISALGRADKVEVSVDSCKIIGGKGDPEDVKARVKVLETRLKEISSDFEKEKLQERLAKLTGGAAIIEVGGESDLQINETKERVIDAVAATKAAVEEGIVAGGGVTYLIARNKIAFEENNNDDIDKGMQLVYDALEKPIQKLLENAGIERGKELPVDGVTGYDVQTGEQVDMLRSGIIDPTKVTRLALEKAANIASLILTTEALITEIPEDKKSPLEQSSFQ